MTTRKDLKPAAPELPEPDVSETNRSAILGREPVGRIVHDDRGNAVWKWRDDTSTTGSNSGILKHLDPQDLKVEGGSGGKGEGRTPDAGGGYDPYNQHVPRVKAGTPKKGSPGKR